MGKNIAVCVGLIALLLITTGCQLTPPSFSITAGNVGSAFAASETTLLYAHEGKITYAYAASSFVNFQSELNSADQTLASSRGTPDASAMRQLLALYQAAMQVVNAPCLHDTCNWRTQVAVLDRASQAFIKAGNS
jgi:hypothetical protein